MTKRDPGRVLILGCGPAGLGAAHRLHALGVRDFEVLEAGEGAGGLASSVVDESGFTWDLGGHVQFSHYAHYNEVLGQALAPDEWLWHERESWVWFKHRFVPYPFQNNLHRLDTMDRDAALRDLERAAADRQATAPPDSFGAWLTLMFGDTLARLFMRPYNLKVWGYPLDRLGTYWVGDRVAVPDLERIKGNIQAHRDDVSWGPNRRFRFPLRGGTGAIWKRIAASLPKDHLLFGARVTAVDSKARRVTLENGRRLAFDTLVSTIPLDRLVAITDPLPQDARRASRNLVFSSVHVVGIGLEGPAPSVLRKKCWMYFPERHSPYYRITVFSNYSPHHVPDAACWSLMAEVCESSCRPVNPSSLLDDVVGAMRRDTLIAGDATIVSRWHRRLHHGYPTPFRGRDGILAAVLPALEARRVFSRGRFGAWKYEVSNQDHSFMQGVEIANRLVCDTPEVTITDPNLANSGVFLQAECTTR